MAFCSLCLYLSGLYVFGELYVKCHYTILMFYPLSQKCGWLCLQLLTGGTVLRALSRICFLLITLFGLSKIPFFLLILIVNWIFLNTLLNNHMRWDWRASSPVQKKCEYMLLRMYEYYRTFLNWGATLVTQMVKNPPAMQETWVGFLGQEDPLEKEMATYSSILAWRILRTEEPGQL